MGESQSDVERLLGDCLFMSSTFPPSQHKIQPLPASTQPVFSMAMHGVVACCTQTGNREKRVCQQCVCMHLLDVCM